jgi:N6-L-threonylcarbamoyladenine synthase
LLILALETSCDDSAAALLGDDGVAAEAVATQTEHGSYGGVVPEIASRLHMSTLPGLVGDVLASAGAEIGDVDAFAATAGPGLIGSLLVGLSWAKAAAWARGRPFLGINHLSAHLHIHYSGGNPVRFPAVALLISGGHTGLFRMDSWRECILLGSTRDDAAGEAFDKTARLMGLGYPGGAVIEDLAREGNSSSIDLPRPLADPSVPEFSFSGLKTAARLQWESGAGPADLAASFQQVIVDILADKLMHQAEACGAATVLAAGGVCANGPLRSRLARECSDRGIDLRLPEKRYATDNAVMVAMAARAVLDSDPSASSKLSCNAFSRWEGERLAALVDPSEERAPE